ncbi:MAG: hypothetical protein ACRCVT_09200 [Leadbetterella sp.]
MCLLFMVSFPILLYEFGIIPSFKPSLNGYNTQLLFIFSFPGLVAVMDLVKVGKGTPFPYDATRYLVRNGVYGYIKNPIQWSFTLLFVWQSLVYSNPIFLVGSLASILYSISISDFQESFDMQEKFGKQYLDYKKAVPKWWFSFFPNDIAMGTIYFDSDCQHCNQLMQWFLRKKTLNLQIKNAKEYRGDFLLQATYVDSNGNEYKSSQAIAYALEHIHLGYASLGWFMRLPILSFIIQAIVDTFEFEKKYECKTETLKE